MNTTTSFMTDMYGGLSNSTNSTTARISPPRLPQPPIGYYGDARVMMWKVIPPIIMSWGTIGNILTIIVLVRQMKRLSSTAMFLLSLAVSDTIILWSGPFRNWVSNTWDLDVRYMSDAGCKIQLYFTYTSIHLSSWLLVAVTVERALSVVLPHKVKIGCTPRNAGIVICCIVVFVFGADCVMPIINGLEGYRKGDKCAPTTEEYKNFRDNIFEWIDFCIAFAAPFPILLVSNILIIVTLYRSKSGRKKMHVKRGKGIRDAKSVSVLLIALCVIFFFTIGPVSIFQIYAPHRRTEIFKIKNPYERWYAIQYLLFQYTVVSMVGYTNAAFNFVLYVFSGTKFRAELKALFCCKTAVVNGVFGSSSGKTQSSAVKSSKASKQSTSSRKLVDKPSGLDNGVLEKDSERIDSVPPCEPGKEENKTNGNGNGVPLAKNNGYIIEKTEAGKVDRLDGNEPVAELTIEQNGDDTSCAYNTGDNSYTCTSVRL